MIGRLVCCVLTYFDEAVYVSKLQFMIKSAESIQLVMELLMVSSRREVGERSTKHFASW